MTGKFATAFASLLCMVCASTSAQQSGPFRDDTFATTWRGEFLVEATQEYIDVTVEVVREGGDGVLALRVQFAPGSQMCDVDLLETGSEIDDYLVSFVAVSKSMCQGDVVENAFLMPFFMASQWPNLRLYANGNLLASGNLGGSPARLLGVDDELVSKAWYRREDAENNRELAAIAATEQKSLGGLCRSWEIEHGNRTDPRWCQCLDENFQEQLDEQEYRTAIADYDAFYLLMVQSPDQSGDWRYNNVLNTCRACKDQDYRACLPSKDMTPGRRTYTRMLATLTDRSRPSVEENRLYSEFFTDYLAVYSDACKARISSGVERTTTFQDFDRSGSPVGPPIVADITIETGYITAYDRHLAATRNPSKLDLEGKTAEQLVNDVRNWPAQQIRRIFETRSVLGEHMSAGCQSGDVQFVYRRLYDLEH